MQRKQEDCSLDNCEIRRRACSGYSCDDYEVGTDVTVGEPPFTLKQHDWVVTWRTTADLQVPAFFAFQDAVRYEVCGAGDEWQVTRAAYAELKKSGQFPLARLLSNPGLPTYGAGDLAFHRVGWTGSVLKGPIDPAVFTVVSTDSILSPALPANYKKVDPPLAACIASLREMMALIRKNR